MNGTICQAIRGRFVISFFYDGGVRNVEPHVHGTSTAGNDLVRAFQVSGHSQSAERQGWKLFDISKMGPVTLTAETFPGSRPGYNPADPAMQVIHCRL